MKLLLLVIASIWMVGCASKVIVNYDACEQRGEIDGSKIAKCPVFELK